MTAMQPGPIEMRVPRPGPRPGVVERLTQILDVFATGPERILLEDITSLTGLPRSTAFRILSQLVDLQWLEHDSRGYSLGARVHGISSRGSNHTAVRSAAANVLNDLHLATGAVAHLTVLEGGTVHYLDKVGGAASSSIPSRVGARLPAEKTVSGRALLACLAPERVDALMTLGRTEDERVDLVRLHAQLNQVRRKHGLAYAPIENCSSGIGSVAAPILGPDGSVGAISAATRGAVPLDTVAPMVAFAARRTSQMMFPGWGARLPAAHRVRRLSAACAAR